MAISVAILAGCASNDNDIAEQLAKIQEQQAEIKKMQLEQEQERLENEVEQLPDWVLNPPAPDETGFYAVGIGETKKLDHSLRLAKLKAEFELAKQYKQELSGSERAFEQAGTDGQVQSQSTFLIDKIVDAVPVVGYKIVEQDVKVYDGMHHVFVLMKLPYDEFNRALQSEKSKTLNTKVKAEFDDLERRLDKRREQKEQSAQKAFERQQEAIKQRSEILNAQDSESEQHGESVFDQISG